MFCQKFSKDHHAQRPTQQCLPCVAAICLVAFGLTPTICQAATADATALLRSAFDNWRGKSSATKVTMTIHRPTWERHLAMTVWTQGDAQALVRFTAPAKDAGNATLKRGKQTWIYNPKLNQVIKLPPSLLAQSWMGSDFSYNDLSKSEDILTDYTHKIIGETKAGGHMIYAIEAIPKTGAPVVWGKQEVKVRDDGVFLEEAYFDQDMKPVRTMTTDKIGPLGGRTYPLVLTMRPAGQPGQWTKIVTTEGKFDLALPDFIFTRSNLENPRE